MQIVEAVRQWWSVQPCLRKLEALGPVARAELARDNAITEADLRQLAANSEIDSGRGQAILTERERIKRKTISQRRLQHQLQAA